MISSLKKIFIVALFTVPLLLLAWNFVGSGSFEDVIETLPVKNKICSVNPNDSRKYITFEPDLKVIYYVTPTYPRPEQMPELTRLSHTLMHVPAIHWIVADDQALCSNEVLTVIRRTGLPFTHISSPKPHIYQTGNYQTKPRGVANRRAALEWLQDNVKDGILYFGDDDNTVDLQLFNEIRNTKKVSMFPVGLIGHYGVSSPIVKNGKVVEFFDSWPGSRKFPVDMAGFAVNIGFLKPSATMPYIAGYEEDRFLASLNLKLDEIEPLANNCSKILVWHTKTVQSKTPKIKLDINNLNKIPKYRYFTKLLNEITSLGMITVDPDSGRKVYITRNHRTFDFNSKSLGGD